MRKRRVPEEVGIAVVVVLVALLLSLLSPTFRSLDNVGLLLLNGTVIAFLASDAASYIVGETVEVNGGQLML